MTSPSAVTSPSAQADRGVDPIRMHYIIRRIAGTFVLVSLALGYWVSPYWYLFTAFVGLNLLQSGFTRWCLMETILGKLGVGRRK